MPPKRINSKNSNDTPQIKKLRGRQKKSQSPISIQIQIPVQESLNNAPKRSRKNNLTQDRKIEITNEVITPKRSKKNNLSQERKIELANEVIHTQLARKVQMKNNPNLTERKPATIDCTTVVPNDVKEKYDKKTVRKVVRKRAINKTEAITEPTITRKRAADSTQQLANARKVTVKDTAQQKPSKDENPVATAKVNNVRPKRITRGKKKNNDVVSAVQNSLPTLDEVENTEEVKVSAAAIDSRKTSMTSASSLSWTKDISSSSTTTCVTVCTNDFVRIDNKIPIIQLTNVDSEIQKYKKSETDDDASSDSDSSSSSDSSNNDIVDIPSVSLNLSTSSPSVCKDTRNCSPKSDSIQGDVTKALVKLSSMLKNFDLEIMNWIGYGENIDETNKKYNDKILNVLKEESQVIAHCRQLKRILSDKEPEETDVKFNSVVNLNVSFDDDNPITKDNVLLNENVEYPRSPKSPSTTYDSDYVLDNCMAFGPNNDDDDALSLFAESITGIEPSKTNGSSASPGVSDEENEEYIPQPVNNDTTPEKYEYRPTKITYPAVKKNVCEKQNADSTSIYKELGNVNMCHSEVEKGVGGPLASYYEDLDDGEILDTEAPNQIGPPQGLSIFQQGPRKKTSIFRSFCFYHLMNVCKKANCNFPHVEPNLGEIKMRLMTLSENMFIEEYMFLSSYPILRRKYGFYFVQECHRRGLPRILVEIAIDFVVNYTIKSKEDSDFLVSILEFILLSLNDVGLAVCEDLLDYPVDDDTGLCHVLMRVIASSQNFSRFKDVFMNLTNVMVRRQRTFHSYIASQILERVCILPAEERLLHAVFNIIMNTDSCIFNNRMMPMFESRLMAANRELYEEYMAFKNNAPAMSNLVSTIKPAKGTDLEPLNINCVNQIEKERYTSPDTTKGDTLQNNPAIDIPTMRPVNATRRCYNNKFSPTPPKRNVENWLNNQFRRWRQTSPMAPPPPLMSLPLVRPLRPHTSRQVSVYRTPSSKYRQRPPRNF